MNISKYQRDLNVIYVTIGVFVLFVIANPKVFLSFSIYNWPWPWFSW
jgi:hypothetical protein